VFYALVVRLARSYRRAPPHLSVTEEPEESMPTVMLILLSAEVVVEHTAKQ